MPARDRNKVKFATWGVYLTVEARKHAYVFKKLKDATELTKARVPGGPPATLQAEKKSKHRVEITWPQAISEDTCVRFLRIALGDSWGSQLGRPAGVSGTEAVTAV
jgi:hypothetical protein